MKRREHIQQLGLFLGYSVSFGGAALLMESCKNDVNKIQGSVASTSIFSDNQSKLLEQLAETIIPKTDSPGAIDTHCPQFISKLVNEIYTDEDKADFMKGLDEIDGLCKSKTGKAFLESTSQEREAFLTELDKISPKFPPVMWGIVLVKNTEPVGFFRKLKAATLMAYFTSKELSEYNKQKVSHG
jgi:hypothetical protein